MPFPSDEDWLERLVAPLRQADTAMVYGGQIGHALSKFSEARDFERMFPQQPQTVIDRRLSPTTRTPR